jgi:hypothetical protein
MKPASSAVVVASFLTAIAVSGCTSVVYTPAAGTAATGTNPDRILRVTEHTKYVTVMPFETVRFVIRDAAGKESSFDWRFDSYGSRVFQLADIAPSGLLGNRSIEVWIQRAPPQD